MQQKNTKIASVAGTLPQSISSCLFVLDKFMKQGATVVSSMVVLEKRKTQAGTAGTVVDEVANLIGINP